MAENNSFVLQPDSEGGALSTDFQANVEEQPANMVGKDVNEAHKHFMRSSPEDGEDQLMEGLGEIQAQITHEMTGDKEA